MLVIYQRCADADILLSAHLCAVTGRMADTWPNSTSLNTLLVKWKTNKTADSSDITNVLHYTLTIYLFKRYFCFAEYSGSC